MRTQQVATISQPDRIAADVVALAEMVDPDANGWSRPVLTEFDGAGRRWVLQQMITAGLDARIDGAGNVIGALRGTSPGAGTLMTGSHTDTVVGGGRFDGIVGVAAALECVRSLIESGTRLRHDLVVVNFYGEEPNRFGISCVGSRAMTATIGRKDLDRVDAMGVVFGHELSRSGIDPSDLLASVFDMSDVRAFVELHIEQGPFMEEQGSQIGVVSSITGIKRFRVAFQGRPDHAGTTPMGRRHDAGCAAAGSVLAIEQIASRNVDGRGTTGLVTFAPDAVNVVTELANLWGEFRSPDLAWLDAAAREFEEASQKQGDERGVTVALDWLPSEKPAVMDDALQKVVIAQADRLGLRQSRLYSGAEHDAAIIAKKVPTTMIFVPSRDGRSHCPEEFTAQDEITAGADVLLNTLIALDGGH